LIYSYCRRGGAASAQRTDSPLTGTEQDIKRAHRLLSSGTSACWTDASGRRTGQELLFLSSYHYMITMFKILSTSLHFISLSQSQDFQRGPGRFSFCPRRYNCTRAPAPALPQMWGEHCKIRPVRYSRTPWTRPARGGDCNKRATLRLHGYCNKHATLQQASETASQPKGLDQESRTSGTCHRRASASASPPPD
jgi:hypothetical protein